MEQRNFYTLEKLFQRVIEKNPKIGNEPITLPLCSRIWNTFVKWCRNQLEQERNLIIVNTFQVSTKLSPDDLERTILLGLTDQFLMKNGLMMTASLDLSFPIIKINFVLLAKSAEVDKTFFEFLFQLIFEEIKNVIVKSKQVTIDLGLIGKLKLKQRKIDFQPIEKTKMTPSAIKSKTTVRSLMQKQEKPKRLPKLQHTDNKLRPIDTVDKNRSKLAQSVFRPQYTMNQGNTFSLVSKLSNTFREVNQQVQQQPVDSPTRRYKTHKIGIKKQMLGAGIDPLNKQQDFSILASSGKNLMSAHFVKPGAMKARFPPVLNVFSRTLASPICSSPFPLPLPHRIGSNLSQCCIGLYIHQQKKCLMFQNTFLHSFQANEQFFKSIATQKQQVEYGSLVLNDQSSQKQVSTITYKEKKQLESKILRKKQMYERYCIYLSTEIDSSCVADIKAYWTDNIIGKVLDFTKIKNFEQEREDFVPLQEETINDIIQDNIDSMVFDYDNAMKKSILDYVLLDNNQKKRLGINYIHKATPFWGTQPVKSICADHSWREMVSNNKQTIQQQLVICSSSTWSILHSWEIDFKKKCRLLILPEKGDRRISLSEFCKRQVDNMQEVKKTFMQQFCKNVLTIYEKQIAAYESNEYYIKKFCQANATLLSNILRDLIYQAFDEFVQFIKRFDTKPLRPVKQIMNGQINNPLTYQFEDAFIIVELTNNDNQIVLRNSTESIKQNLLKILDDLIKVSQQVSRPEAQLRKVEKQTLPELTTEDTKYRQSYAALSPLLTKLLQPLDNLITDLDPYLQYFELNLNNYLKQPPTIKSMKQQLIVIEQMNQHIDELPFFSCSRVAQLDFKQIKQTLTTKVGEYRKCIINHVYSNLIKSSQDLSKNITNTFEYIKTKPQTTQKLIQIEQQIMKIRKQTERRYRSEYDDIRKWLNYLYSIDYDFTTDDYIIIYKSALLLFSLPQKVNQQQARIQDEKIRLQQSVSQTRTWLNNQITTLIKNIQKLRDYNDYFDIKFANQNIDLSLSKIEQLSDMIQRMNKDEELLQLSSITEFPKLEESQNLLKPYQDLWRLANDYDNYNKQWSKDNPIFKLNPENIKREVKKMANVINKLSYTFSNNKERPEKGKKVVPLTGPAKMIQWLNQQVKEYVKNIPVIEVFSNPGMKERHWKQVSILIDLQIIPQQQSQLKLNNIVSRQQVFTCLQKLQQISQNATKQYTMQKGMSKMYDDWNGIEVELKKWKDTGTHIVAGSSIDQIQQILDDHIVKTQMIKGDPFAKVFEDQIKDWEDWLNYTLQFSEFWVKVQSVWLYLEPIFSSPDILKHLPMQGAKFQQVDVKWKQMMAQIVQQPRVLDFTKKRTFLVSLKQCHDILEIVQKGLNAYLQGKRASFPRFYFLSNDQLLQILSETKDPARVQPHLKKCFEGIQKLKFDQSNKVLGMYSSEGQYVNFVSTVDTNAANGNVDMWLLWTQSSMIESVKDVTIKAFQDYTKIKRDQWVRRRCGMAVLCISMAFWTTNSEAAIDAGPESLEQFSNKLTNELQEIVNVVRQDITALDRCTIEALIVLDVHNRDMIAQLKTQGIQKTSQFAWQSQLRYYWENNDVWVRIINAKLQYNYEYLGNSSRLVITPLTDRCYRTLCGALNLNYGGAPEGPAGTGKTETVKDLAKALARQCVVFNCSDGLDYKAMGKFFKGLASSGAWSCFDQFNRIDLEVLSVVAQQILTITLARAKGLERFFFEDCQIPLKKTANCFITMNPGYAGRSQLPDNLKALFRAVAMMVPDYAMIAEISLYSFGFSDARNLARKIVTTYKLCSEQLSSQDHYDYGMRAVKSVLTAAGNLKRKFASENQSILMLRAINDVNLAKFLAFDLPLFKGITSDLFPGVSLPQIDYKHMKQCIDEKLIEHNLQKTDYVIEKIIQLYQMVLVRHGLMVVGLPFSGKSSAIKILAGALTLLNQRNQMGQNKTQLTILNPKSITMKQLYGYNDQISHQWTDGVLAVKFRAFAKSEDTDRKWLIFDGPVDAVWIENMNTVLDDNKKLCLNSGQIIAMSKPMNLMFEPMDLQAASPATVSRCGMVYMQPGSMGWKILYYSWQNTLPAYFTQQDKQLIESLFMWTIDPTLQFIRGNVSQISPTQDQNLVQTLMRYYSILLKQSVPNEQQYNKLDAKIKPSLIEGKFAFSYFWSMGGSANTQNRKVIESFMKKLLSGDIKIPQYQKRRIFLPDRGSLFDYNYVPRKSMPGYEWCQWVDFIDIAEKIPPKTQTQEIIVKTNDTMRYSYLLEINLRSENPSIFCGPTGTGKSCYIKNYINSLPEASFMSIEIGFSAQTSSIQTQDIIDSKVDRKRKGVYGPKIGKGILFVDDLNMPAKQKYGAQPPIQLLRQFIDQGGWYQHKDKQKPFRTLQGIVLVAAMGPPGGGRTFITPRLLRHLTLTSLTSFEDETLTRIFNTILHWYFASNNFNPQVVKCEQKIITSTLDLYKTAMIQLLPTPLKSHYLFNLRDFAKVIYGICMVDREKLSTQDQSARLWMHQIMRVFGDRLINEEDRLFLFNLAKQLINKVWMMNFDKTFEHLDRAVDGIKDGKVDTLEQCRGLLWTDCMTPLGASKRQYEQVLDNAKLQAAIDEQLVNYNSLSDKPMDLVMFSFAIEHLLIIARILKQPSGNALLVGVGGSGRQSLTRLASKISDYEIIQIQISKTYGKVQWKQDLKKILKQSGGKNIPTVFLFTDSQIKDQSFIEDINNLLNTYEVPNLFPADQKNELMQMCRPIAKAENKLRQGTPSQLYSFFVEKCKKNLHVVLCFSPIGDAFRTRVRMFPSLVNCCTIDWFQQWPQDGLLWVARRFLNAIQMQESIRQKCVQMVQFFHQSTSKWAKQFEKKLKRKYYVTPTSYIQLITTFKNLLTQKRKEVMQNINKYENGYEKIITTQKSVEQMQTNLTELQPKLKQAAAQTEIKMKQVAEKKGQADILKGTIQEQESVTQQAVDEANVIKADCQKELQQALPALRSAQQALKVLDRKKIDLLKTFKSPPQVIRVVMKALCIVKYPNPKETFKNPDTLKTEVDWWAASLKLLNNPKLLDQLLAFDIENADEQIISNLGKYLKDPVNEPQLKLDVVQNASTACKCIIMWLNGIHSFYYVNKKVIPKKKALAESQTKVKGLNAQLAEKQKLLKNANDKVAALNDQLQSTVRYKEQLEKQYDDCSKQLVRAVQLIQNLGGQKGRWGELGKQLRVFYEYLTGDILVSSGLIAYLGAFTSAFRVQITNQWASQCKNKQIPSSQTFNLQNTLGDPVKIRQWNIDGLPSDDFSIQNAIIIFKSRRWPLCIDPQGQANKWIKKMQNKNKLFIIKLSDSDFLRTLQNAIQFGRPVLLENVGEQLDPALQPILLKQTFLKGATQYIKLGDQVIEYSNSFRFYITTKYRNPHYLPQISTKVAIINFMITYQGLNDQLLGILVKKERPDLEEQKERLILQGASNKKQLFEIEQKILQVLSSEKNILKDEEAIDILTASKTKSNEIKQKQEISEITQKNIDSARQQYKPVSQEAACLFFSISDLANIDPMYQYSLTYYIDLFTQSILKSQKSGNLVIRLKHLRSYFLYSLYSNICRSLFEKDKLLFSFLLCVRLAEFKGTITNEQIRFLLTGGVALDDFLPQKPQNSDWLSIKSWGQIYRLSKIQKFETLIDDVAKNVDAWKTIYDSPEPQTTPLPEGSQKYGMFEKLMILRTIRPDKLMPAVQDFVTDQLGNKFITPPPFDLAKIYTDSSSTTPLIFILSPGSDPFASLNSFAQQKKKKISSISLGQGQGPLAQRMINDGQKNGDWVVLQNCHLAVTWMPILQKICQQFSPDPTILHPQFRLWLTSYPSDKFPTAILQNGVKMTNQPPKGLKANLIGSYLTDPISTEQFFEGNTNQPQNFKTLIYSLTFFHAVIQQRRKYGPLGWNIGYEFNESDLRISVRQLKMFLDESGKIPFAALKYLTAQCNYGGRVTDDKDRRLITTLLNDYFNDEVLENQEYSFSPDSAFVIPRVSTKQQYIEHIKSLPHLIHPNVFGFHANADITKDINETNLLLESLLLCSSQSEQSKGLSQQQILTKLVNTILSDFPKEYDLAQIVKKYPVEYTESMNTVLTQELTRFNALISIVRSSLSDIGLALIGKIIMSTALQAASKSLFNGKVPDMWMAKSYPSLKPLSSYMTDLKARLSFFQKWIDEGPPVVFWISGFFFTQSFLTGVLQNFARKYTIPIDQIVFDFEFMNIQPYTKPQNGAYVEGLFIEGSKWNYESMQLDESDPKVLFVKCPVILLKPSHSSKLQNYKHYNCPVYKTSARRGVLSTTGHSTNFVMMIRLPTSEQQKHWIKRGVALLTQLDD